MAWHSLTAAVFIFILLIGFGTWVYIHFENLSFFDALYLTIISITTVGYGDIVPQTKPARVFTLFIVATGFGLFSYILGGTIAGFLEGHLKDLWGEKRMRKRIAALSNHVIVCGAGRVGTEVIKQLHHENVPFVVIEKNPEHVRRLNQPDLLYLIGDATEDSILLEAGIKRARAVIAALPEDAGNLFITVTCRDLNPNVRVIARSYRPEGAGRLKRAGAECVISPSAIAGNRMAMAALKPHSVHFIQTLMERPDVNLELEEIYVAPGSELAGVALKNSGLKEKYSAQLLVIRRNDDLIISPAAEEIIRPGDLLIVFGPADRLAELEKVAGLT